VPLVSGFACAVPAVLSTRMIDNEKERLATIAVLPLMSCSARLPVYVVLIGAFFPVSQAGFVLFSLYAMGIAFAAVVAWILRRTRLKGAHAVLMMELPVYQRPSFRVVKNQVLSGCREFLVTAGTIIMATAILIWVLSYYPRPAAIHEAHAAERAPLSQALAALPADAPARAEIEGRLGEIDAREKAAYLEQSILAEAGKAIQPLFAPAGFDWRTTVGVLAAFPARELVIPTLGILYSLGDVDPGEYDVASLDAAEAHRNEGLAGRLRAARNEEGAPAWTSLSALAVMVFFALCSQCMATLGAIRRETRSWRWPVFVFSYMTALAWVMAVLVYQIGRALGFGVSS
jgi:ferrous iron transport protein B